MKILNNSKPDGAANCPFFILIHRGTADTKLTDFVISPILSEIENARVLITTNERAATNWVKNNS